MVKILVINPGSTSTKIGYFEDQNKIWDFNIQHASEYFNKEINFEEDVSMRVKFIKKTLVEKKITLKSIDVFATRGGASKPIPGGTYLVTKKLLEIQKELHPKLLHPSNLAPSIGFQLAKENQKKTFFTDSPMTSEIMNIAKISGYSDFKREARFHALNQKAVAKKWASENGLKYENVNLIVAHLGGGISIGAHQKGVVIDVNDGVEEGPFSPNRAGTLPVLEISKLADSFEEKEVKLMLQGKGGLFSYLNEVDFKNIEKKINENDLYAKEVVDAMIYQVSHEIGARAIALKGKVDGIILTGGIAFSNYFVKNIKLYTSWISNIFLMPGEFELQALALGAFLAFTNQIETKEV